MSNEPVTIKELIELRNRLDISEPGQWAAYWLLLRAQIAMCVPKDCELDRSPGGAFSQMLQAIERLLYAAVRQ